MDPSITSSQIAGTTPTVATPEWYCRLNIRLSILEPTNYVYTEIHSFSTRTNDKLGTSGSKRLEPYSWK